MYRIIFIALLTSVTIGYGSQVKESIQHEKDSIEKKSDTSFKLNKIIFHTSTCLGLCPVYHLQIDNNRQFKLFAETVYRKGSKVSERIIDVNKTGYFTGTVSKDKYKKLIKQLQLCNIDTLTFEDVTCCDAPLITIIVYYNGKRKYLKSMFPPDSADDLITTLNDICEKSNLHRSKFEFTIEE